MSEPNEELARIREELRQERAAREASEARERQERAARTDSEARERQERAARAAAEARARQAEAARIAAEQQAEEARIVAEQQVREEREEAARLQKAIQREQEEHQRVVQGQTLHEYLSQAFKVAASNLPRLFPKPKPKRSQTSETKSSTTGRTDIVGKHYPRRVCLWPEFEGLHRETWAQVEAAVAEQRLFPSVSQVKAIEEGVLEELPSEFLDSGSFLTELKTSFFIHETLEKPVSKVLNSYLATLDAPKIIFFDSRAAGLRPQSLSNASDTQDTGGSTPPPSRPLAKAHPDCIVMRKGLQLSDGEPEEDENDPTLPHIFRCTIGEHKAAHRLRAAVVSRILSGPLPEDYMVQLAKRRERTGRSPSDDNSTPAAAFPTTASTTSKAKAGGLPNQVFFAYALSQAYHYLLVSGLEFGYVASGEMLTFLRIPEDDYTTLFYYTLVFPGGLSRESPTTTADAYAEDEIAFRSSAISQLCSLCLLAINASDTPRPATWRATAIAEVPKFPMPYGGTSLPTPSIISDRSSASSSESSQSRDSSLGKRRRPDGDDGDDDGDDGDEGGDGGGGDGGNLNRSTRGRLQIRPHQPRVPSPLQHHEFTNQTAADHGACEGAKNSLNPSPLTAPPQRLQYCTQACLLGLVRGQELDYDCPNASAHLATHTRLRPNYHPITQSQLSNLVRSQLQFNLDQGCRCHIDMGIPGAIGYLFTITLLRYGYTFVAKGVEREYRRRLDRESEVYRGLADFQGQLIPVYLGTIKLVVPYPMVNFTSVTHMMLLSYAGLSLYSSRLEKRAERLGLDVDWDREAERTAQELRAAGLVDSDEDNISNMMWCEDTQRAMRIDFDHAHVGPAQAFPRHAEEGT